MVVLRRLSLAAVLVSIATTKLSAQDLYVRDARALDLVAQEVLEGNLLISGDTIVAWTASPPANFSGSVIEAAGKWIIPGLHDLHTHSVGNQAPGGVMAFTGTADVAKRMLFAGVTGFLDLFARESDMFALRDGQRTSGLAGADIFAAGPCLTATRGHCTEYGVPTRIIDTPEDAHRQIAELALRAPDVVKIVYDARLPTIDRQTLQAAIEAAEEAGLSTVIHIGTWQEARDAVLAGATAITHVPTEGPVPDDVVEAMVARGTYLIPTLVVLNDLARFVADPSLLSGELATRVAHPAIAEAYGDADALDATSKQVMTVYGRTEGLQRESVRILFEAGVPMLTGTDSGNLGTIQGYSVHRELVWMVEAGLSPWQALAASTVNAGRFLGRSYGVSPGDEASLVLLDASPIEDIRNTERIHLIIHRGRVVDRAALIH